MTKSKLKHGDTLKSKSDGILMKMIGVSYKNLHFMDDNLNHVKLPLSSYNIRSQYDLVPDNLYLDKVNEKVCKDVGC